MTRIVTESLWDLACWEVVVRLWQWCPDDWFHVGGKRLRRAVIVIGADDIFTIVAVMEREVSKSFGTAGAAMTRYCTLFAWDTAEHRDLYRIVS